MQIISQIHTKYYICIIMTLPVISVWFLYHAMLGAGSPVAWQVKLAEPVTGAVVFLGSLMNEGPTTEDNRNGNNINSTNSPLTVIFTPWLVTEVKVRGLVAVQ